MHKGDKVISPEFAERVLPRYRGQILRFGRAP